MTKPENIFLTDNRRNVLEGTSEWSEKSIINEKARIKNRASLALEELTEVAESDKIDHTDAFDPDDVFRLLSALLTGLHSEHIETSGVVEDATRDDVDDLPDDPQADFSDEFENYQNELRTHLARLVLKAEYSD